MLEGWRFESAMVRCGGLKPPVRVMAARRQPLRACTRSGVQSFGWPVPGAEITMSPMGNADGWVVRTAKLADLDALRSLLALLFEQEADFAPDRAKQERGLRMIVEEPAAGMVFCAEHPDAGVIGMVSILFSVSTAEGGRVAWLEDMVVRPDWRGRGIGKILLENAIAVAREAGCLRVTLLTDLTNGDAMRFYERSGFTRSGMTPMRLKL